MTTQTAISSIHKLAIGCSLVTGTTLIALLVFSVQTSRAKQEYQDYDTRIIQPERQKWQSVASKPTVGLQIEPLPSPSVSIFEEQNRLAMEVAVVTFRRDVALNTVVTAGVLSALMFTYHSILKKKVPIQYPE
jgi:hypothetical protein